MSKKKRNVFKRIKDRINGEHSSCPAYWWEAGMEDCSEGCHINRSYTFECWRCNYRFLPNIVVSVVVKFLKWKEERYWKKEITRMNGEIIPK